MTPSLLMAVLASGFVTGLRRAPVCWPYSALARPPMGEGPGAGFLCGHLLGDVVWCGTALVAIVGAREIGSTAFDVLGVLSGSPLGTARAGVRCGRVAAVPRRRKGRRGSRSGMASCLA